MGSVVSTKQPHARTPRVALAAATAALCSLAALPGGAAGERAPSKAKCDRDLTELEVKGCRVLLDDTSRSADPVPIWGSIDCESADRQRRIESGGDPHATATGAAQGDDAYRELSVRDGDDFFGERCELGRNDHRDGPTAIYRRGRPPRHLRLLPAAAGYPLENERWQVVMQIKQSRPRPTPAARRCCRWRPSATAGGCCRAPRPAQARRHARAVVGAGRSRRLDPLCLRRHLLAEDRARADPGLRRPERRRRRVRFRRAQPGDSRPTR